MPKYIKVNDFKINFKHLQNYLILYFILNKIAFSPLLAGSSASIVYIHIPSISFSENKLEKNTQGSIQL